MKLLFVTLLVTVLTGCKTTTIRVGQCYHYYYRRSIHEDRKALQFDYKVTEIRDGYGFYVMFNGEQYGNIDGFDSYRIEYLESDSTPIKCE